MIGRERRTKKQKKIEKEYDILLNMLHNFELLRLDCIHILRKSEVFVLELQQNKIIDIVKNWCFINCQVPNVFLSFSQLKIMNNMIHFKITFDSQNINSIHFSAKKNIQVEEFVPAPRNNDINDCKTNTFIAFKIKHINEIILKFEY